MNNKECESVQKLLERNDIESAVLKDDSKITGVVISTVYQSKGLEFDSVILNDASEKQFDQKSEVEMKLLYVALTSVLDELSQVVYPFQLLLFFLNILYFPYYSPNSISSS